MQPVIFPLKLQMKRAEVGDLHQTLSALGFTIAQAEKKNQRFGASTREAVRKFQLVHKLPARKMKQGCRELFQVRGCQSKARRTSWHDIN